MPPLPPPSTHTPRVILYHQTHHTRCGHPISLLPLLTEPTSLVPITHLILAAIHLNTPPGNITLNDDPPWHPKNASLRSELATLQAVGVRVLGMLGGAAPGTFTRLDTDNDPEFECYYAPLRHMVREWALDGLDLDVEEPMSLRGIIRLIDRLKHDFGPAFLITLAPVAGAMSGGQHLSGFDYEALEVLRGGSVSWYNVQFYNGWGSLLEGAYEEVMARGWTQEKIVAGVLTNQGNGHGWVASEEVGRVVRQLREVWPWLGGVMGWEYFNAGDGGEEGRGWEWGEGMMRALGVE
ncbi:MAG: hypothetical protein LQ345_006650 [Seirophora villosa]|nr:MAG: hypothetical protein LQ345_006650 [Seirophora villosa]